MIKLVLFDWDGTILDNATAGLDSENDLLRLFNLKPITMQKHRDIFEIPVSKFYAKAGLTEELIKDSNIQEIFQGIYEKRVGNAKARTGAGALLKWLHSEGIKSAILSNHTIVGIEKSLKRLKLEKYVETILANELAIHTGGVKDKAEYAEEYLKRTRFNPRQALIVGDAPEEARIARRLHLRSVLITDGWYSKRRLEETKPDYLIKKLNELPRIIKDVQD